MWFKMSDLYELLQGGDRRSIGEVDLAIEMVQTRPERLGELVRGLSHPEPVVRMRCADALEKLTLSSGDLLRPFANDLLDAAEQTKQIEVRWHMAQILPRIKLLAHERNRRGRLLIEYLEDSSRIVQAEALEALVTVAGREASLRPAALEAAEKACMSESPAVRARYRRLKPNVARLQETEQIDGR